jgi:hypothetical protein
MIRIDDVQFVPPELINPDDPPVFSANPCAVLLLVFEEPCVLCVSHPTHSHMLGGGGGRHG